jgi:hypothetical protein
MIRVLHGLIKMLNSFLLNCEIANGSLVVRDGLWEKVGYEICHIFSLECLKVTLFSIILPLASLAAIIFAIRLRIIQTKFHEIKKAIYSTINRRRFEALFNKGTKEDLNKQYILSALDTAATEMDHDKKQNAILQISQFTDDIALNGLIELLHKEKHVAYKYMMINALYVIVRNKADLE